MQIYEITQPGTWLVTSGSNDETRELKQLIESLIHEFYYINNSFYRFSTTKYEKSEGFNEKELKRRMEISQQLRSEPNILAISDPFERANQLNFETDLTYKREKWANGQSPRIFEYHHPYIFANTFIHHLDLFYKYLRALTTSKAAPAGLSQSLDAFLQKFPHLRGVRDSIQHKDDRVRRRRDRSGNPLLLKNGGLLLDSLNLRTGEFTTTMADGTRGTVAISHDTMEALQKILQAVLDEFNWSGDKTHHPG